MAGNYFYYKKTMFKRYLTSKFDKTSCVEDARRNDPVLEKSKDNGGITREIS